MYGKNQCELIFEKKGENVIVILNETNTEKVHNNKTQNNIEIKFVRSTQIAKMNL